MAGRDDDREWRGVLGLPPKKIRRNQMYSLTTVVNCRKDADLRETEDSVVASKEKNRGRDDGKENP